MKSIVFLFLFFSGIFVSQTAFAGSGTIGCYKYRCLLTFQTNAGFLQRAEITGPYSTIVQGRGEGVTHLSLYVPKGIYYVRLIHFHNGWKDTWVRVYRNQINGNDSGRDGDYNDAIVTLH